MRVRPRLETLEALAPKGCGTCEGWWDTMLVDDDGATQRPERCPGCCCLVPIRMTIHIVGVPLDLV